MVANHQDLSGKGVRAAGHEDLFIEPTAGGVEGFARGPARSVTHEQDAGDARGTETIARSMPRSSVPSRPRHVTM